jgi:hypothetical protein
MRRWLFIVVVALAVGLSSLVFAQDDAHIGMWKQDFAKSKFSPAPTGPGPQSSTRKYEKFGDGLKGTLETVSADGKKSTTTWSAHFDGKDYPFLGSPAFDTIAVKKIDNNTFESVIKKSGKVVTTGRNVVSKDGKTLTWTYKGTNSQGQSNSGVTVFERQ